MLIIHICIDNKKNFYNIIPVFMHVDINFQGNILNFLYCRTIKINNFKIILLYATISNTFLDCNKEF